MRADHLTYGDVGEVRWKKQFKLLRPLSLNRAIGTNDQRWTLELRYYLQSNDCLSTAGRRHYMQLFFAIGELSITDIDNVLLILSQGKLKMEKIFPLGQRILTSKTFYRFFSS